MVNILSPEIKAYLESHSKQRDPLLKKMEEFAKINRIPILDPISAEFLELILSLYQPKSFLEIGTAIGYSTIRAARILKDSLISTIESSKDNIKLAQSNFEAAGFEGSINLIEGDALKFLEKTDKKYDFIFLDADKEDYPDYLTFIVDSLVSGGVLLVDNLLWKGYVAAEILPDEYKKSTEFIKKFNAQFLNHPHLKSSIIPIGDGLGLAVKKLKKN